MTMRESCTKKMTTTDQEMWWFQQGYWDKMNKFPFNPKCDKQTNQYKLYQKGFNFV